MPRRTPHVPIRIDGFERARWEAFADRAGLTLEQMIRESVELAMARGSTR